MLYLALLPLTLGGHWAVLRLYTQPYTVGAIKYNSFVISKQGAEASRQSSATRHAARGSPALPTFLYFTLSCVENYSNMAQILLGATEELEDRAGAHAGVLLARCVAQCELVLPGRARRESLGAEDGARVALVDL